MVDYFIYDLATNAEFTEFVTGYRNRIEIAQSITLSNLAPNTTYYFRIAYIKDGIKTPYSNSVLTTDAIPTTTTTTATNPTPTGFRANFNSVADADSYEVDLLNSSNVVLDTVTTTNNYYDFTDLSNLTLYKYRVRVVIEGYKSTNSNLTEITTLSGIPATPTNLVTSSITSTGFTATWDLVDGATSYDISINDGTAIEVFTNTYNASGLSSGISQTWKVRAKNASGDSDYTANQSVLLIPATPTGLAVSTFTNTTATIIWDSSTGASSYKLYIKLSGTPIAGYDGKVIAGTSESVTGLTEGTTYTIEVLATNASGDSALSGSINLITKAQKLLAISNDPTRNYFYTYNSNATGKTRVSSQTTYAEGSSDAWGRISPNGRYVAYSRPTATSTYALFIWDFQTNSETQVSPVGSTNYAYPAWKPDEPENIYCWRNFGTSGNSIVRINISTLALTPVYTTATACFELDFSPDSTNALIRMGAIVDKIRTSDWVNIGFTTGITGGIMPRYTADGTKILYSKLVSGFYQVHDCNANGTSQTPRTTGNVNKYNPIQQKSAPFDITYNYHNGGSDMEIWKMTSSYTGNAVFIDSVGTNDAGTDWGII